MFRRRLCCCGVYVPEPCGGCQSGTTPYQIDVTFSGITDGPYFNSCDECEAYNTTFRLTRHESIECYWTYEFPEDWPCPQHDYISLEISYDSETGLVGAFYLKIHMTDDPYDTADLIWRYFPDPWLNLNCTFVDYEIPFFSDYWFCENPTGDPAVLNSV